MSDSPPPSPPASRQPLSSRLSSHHLPLVPSRLRVAMNMSPVDRDTQPEPKDEGKHSPEVSPLDSPPLHAADPATESSNEPLVLEEETEVVDTGRRHIDARTRLLTNYHRSGVCGHQNCNHGTFTPQVQSMKSRRSSIDSTESYADQYDGTNTENDDSQIMGESPSSRDFVKGIFSYRALSSTKWLTSKTGVKSRRFMYVSYYFPFVKWIRQYQWRWFKGDLIAALTMASFYIPMALSLASNLGHVPPINGLYSFVFNPIIYAMLGTCPQMVVGPEAAGSLLLGSVVKTCIDTGNSGEDEEALNAQIGGVVTGIAGAVIFISGICRLGFLDSVLSRPFLRGFISAIGFVIVIDQLIPELGLSGLSKESVAHGSSVTKFIFLCKNIKQSHGLTSAVSFGAFAIIMVFRTLKRKLQPRYPSVAYFPDRFLVVALSAVFAWQFGWEEKGVEVLGSVKSSGRVSFPFHWPFQFNHMTHIDTALSTSFLIALLGFFESSVAAKSLGEGSHELQGMTLSANRELIALGTANIIGGCFMALPAFGGYGRSKVNASTGGKTPMSSILLSLITLLCVLYMLPYFYYLPKGVLSAMISVVAYSLLEECPHDINFFRKIHGWTELSLMSIIFLATVFYSLTLGIALGIGLSLLQLIRHATKPRIQILGKVPGTTDRFENAEISPEHIEYIEGCLIVKIPEPLTFANTGELKTRLRRLEHYGANAVHPALPRSRYEESNKNIIFDVHGVTSIDGSGTQVLTEIVEAYVQRGVRVFFCRLPTRRSQVYQSFERSGIVQLCGGKRNFVGSVEEALKLSEIEDLETYYDDRMDGS